MIGILVVKRLSSRSGAGKLALISCMFEFVQKVLSSLRSKALRWSETLKSHHKVNVKFYRSSRSHGVLNNFAIFTGKHLCWSLFSIKLRPEALQETLAQIFSSEYSEIFKNSFFIVHYRWNLRESIMRIFKVFKNQIKNFINILRYLKLPHWTAPLF